MHQIRIQSDGTGDATTVTTENGDVLQCLDVKLTFAVGRANTAVVTILLPITDVHANVTKVIYACAFCGERRTHECDDKEVRFIDK